jgi:hypothetical protein
MVRRGEQTAPHCAKYLSQKGRTWLTLRLTSTGYNAEYLSVGWLVETQTGVQG